MKRDQLDCIESDELFVVLKPGSNVKRSYFTEAELRPLLRQAIVATAAAVESYVAEKARDFVADALKNRLPRLKDVTLSLDDVIEIESKYKKRRWGHRAILESFIDSEASADPGQIGKVFSTVGVRGFWPKADARRKVGKGTSETQLRDLCRRRNKIAHTGDRTPTGRAGLSLADAEAHYEHAKSIVQALEAVL